MDRVRGEIAGPATASAGDVDDPHARRERILDAAERRFSQRPYDAVSMEDLARSAGVSTGLLYYHFGSKRGLFAEVVRRAVARLRAHMEPDPEMSAPEQARQALRRYLDHVESQGAGFVALLRRGIGADSEVVAVVDDLRRQTATWLAAGAGLDLAHPGVGIVLAGWPNYVEAAALAWHDARRDEQTPEREAILDALYQVLEAVVAAAHRVTREPAGSP